MELRTLGRTGAQASRFGLTTGGIDLYQIDRREVAGPHCEQPPYSILARGIEGDVLPVCDRDEMGVIVRSALPGGWPTGKYRRDALPPADPREPTATLPTRGGHHLASTGRGASEPVVEERGRRDDRTASDRRESDRTEDDRTRGVAQPLVRRRPER